MKVKVRIIRPPYTDIPTKSLQAIVRNHAHNKFLLRIGTKQLYDIMSVLAERREASGCQFKPNEEALADFMRYDMPQSDPQLRIDYAGGHDHCLVELSDVLPASLYSINTSKS